MFLLYISHIYIAIKYYYLFEKGRGLIRLNECQMTLLGCFFVLIDNIVVYLNNRARAPPDDLKTKFKSFRRFFYELWFI